MTFSTFLLKSVLIVFGFFTINKEMPAVVTKNNSDINQKISPDTARFKTIIYLLDYYKKKFDSMDKTRSVVLKDKDISKSSFHEIEASYLKCQFERNKAILNFLEAHEHNTENLTGIKYLVLDWTIPIARIDSLFQQFPGKLKSSPEGKLWGSKIEVRKRTELKPAYNLSILKVPFNTVQGNVLTLNDIPTKYLLLDFWASWCAPCRHENRNLVKEKEIIENRTDLSIVLISTDKDKSKWIKASLDDSLNYINICDFKEKDSPLWKELKLTTVPYNVIIDKEGNIYGVNLWGENLKAFINTLPR